MQCGSISRDSQDFNEHGTIRLSRRVPLAVALSHRCILLAGVPKHDERLGCEASRMEFRQFVSAGIEMMASCMRRISSSGCSASRSD